MGEKTPDMDGSIMSFTGSHLTENVKERSMQILFKTCFKMDNFVARRAKRNDERFLLICLWRAWHGTTQHYERRLPKDYFSIEIANIRSWKYKDFVIKQRNSYHEFMIVIPSESELITQLKQLSTCTFPPLVHDIRRIYLTEILMQLTVGGTYKRMYVEDASSFRANPKLRDSGNWNGLYADMTDLFFPDYKDCDWESIAKKELSDDNDIVSDLDCLYNIASEFFQIQDVFDVKKSNTVLDAVLTELEKVLSVFIYRHGMQNLYHAQPKRNPLDCLYTQLQDVRFLYVFINSPLFFEEMDNRVSWDCRHGSIVTAAIDNEITACKSLGK